ncbi:uncharacterized protein LOC125179375 [Hyalella azteca]|uniref:Uncharacterized protein LOC125179375 n=1 Tax=Hyalella azteca TaxID=294128 RepID=A0A979FXS7_HYAAZ|nr:uncharacterized protein LOC125179375 [Hyalella azteca]
MPIKLRKFCIALNLFVCLMILCYFVYIQKNTTKKFLPKSSMPLDKEECDLPWWDGALDNCNAIQNQFIAQNNKTRSYCGKRADFAGTGQNVISFCFFGNFTAYASGFPEILQAIKEFYPGWLVRLYTEPTKYVQEVGPLMQQHPNLYVCDVTNLPGNITDLRGLDSRLWRVAVLGDETVDVFLSRDIDSVMLDREVHAVREFLESGKVLHLMRDHPSHPAAILTGMFGVNQTASNRTLLNSIRGQLFGKLKKGSDQALLKNYLYPKLVMDSVTHDSYQCKKFPSTVPFPTKRVNGQFVGNRRYRSKYKNEVVRGPCPKECRPPNHQDWKYC